MPLLTKVQDLSTPQKNIRCRFDVGLIGCTYMTFEQLTQHIYCGMSLASFDLFVRVQSKAVLGSMATRKHIAIDEYHEDKLNPFQ